jgi:multidrug efflux pump subunit AcrB
MISYFVRHPTAATLVMIGLLVIGLFSFPSCAARPFRQSRQARFR